MRKPSYKRGKHMRVSFSPPTAQPQPAPKRVCLSCGNGIDEVMTVPYCFRCYNQSRSRDEEIRLEHMNKTTSFMAPLDSSDG